MKYIYFPFKHSNYSCIKGQVTDEDTVTWVGFILQIVCPVTSPNLSR